MQTFRSGTVTAHVQAADGTHEIVVVQVNITPVSEADEGNMDVVTEIALGTSTRMT